MQIANFRCNQFFSFLSNFNGDGCRFRASISSQNLHAQMRFFLKNRLKNTKNYMHRQKFTCTEQILHAFVHVKTPYFEHWTSASFGSFKKVKNWHRKKKKKS